MLSKEQARLLIRELVDDPDGARWRDTRLDLFTSITLSDLWSEILEAFPGLLVRTETASLDSAGLLQLSELDRPFHRLRRLQLAGRELAYLSDLNERRGGPSGQRGWLLEGQTLRIVPESPGAEVEIRYSHWPRAFHELTEGEAVEWPRGYEAVYVHEVAGRLLTKGAAEDPTVHLQVAAAAKGRMLSALGRPGAGPRLMQLTSTPGEWGG